MRMTVVVACFLVAIVAFAYFFHNGSMIEFINKSSPDIIAKSPADPMELAKEMISLAIAIVGLITAVVNLRILVRSRRSSEKLS